MTTEARRENTAKWISYSNVSQALKVLLDLGG